MNNESCNLSKNVSFLTKFLTLWNKMQGVQDGWGHLEEINTNAFSFRKMRLYILIFDGIKKCLAQKSHLLAL